MSDDFERKIRALLTQQAESIHSQPRPIEAVYDAGQTGLRSALRRRAVILPMLTAAATAAVIAGVALAASATRSNGTGGAGPALGSLGTDRPTSAAASGATGPRRYATYRPLLSACDQRNLAISYLAGSRAGGGNFGSIAIVNSGPLDCVLAGRITVVPTNSNGSRMRVAKAWHNSVRVGAVLTGKGRLPTRSASLDPKQKWLEIILGGSDRTPDGSGTCPDNLMATPAEWRLSGAVAATIENRDPTVAPDMTNGGLARLSACDARGTLSLLNVGVSPEP